MSRRTDFRLITLSAGMLLLAGGAAYWYLSDTGMKEIGEVPSDRSMRVSPSQPIKVAAPDRRREKAHAAQGEQTDRTQAGEGPSHELRQLEEGINSALKREGLDRITAQVSDSGLVTLKGVAGSGQDKQRAFEAVKSVRGVQRTRDMVFVIGK